MGRKHAAARAGIAQAQADEQLREAEGRRTSAERERQLLTSYLGTEEQVAGTGRFNVDPNVLRFTSRYSIDSRALNEIQAAGQGVKNQLNPFQSADNATRGGLSLQEYSQGFATKANDLLAQAEAAAQQGDFNQAEQLYAQAQVIISGVSPEAQGAYNLGGGEESSAAVRASSAEAKIVGRQLLTAQQLGDPNSAASKDLRGRLLDPSLAAIDENTRNAERAIASERTQIEGEIRQRGAGGTGVNARAQLALESQAASSAALQRASNYSQAGAQKAQVTAQVNLYLNEFAKLMAEDSVKLAQEWVNGTAGVRDQYQAALDQFSIMGIQIANDRAVMAAQIAESRRAEEKQSKAFRREFIFGAPLGLLTAGGTGPPTGKSSGVGASSGGVGGGGSTLGGGFNSSMGSEEFGRGNSGGNDLGDFGEQDGGGGGGGLDIGSLAALFA